MKVPYRQLLKEPLIQFLLIGLVLFFGERWINQQDYLEDQFRILVNDQIIAQFMQQQAKNFDPLKAQQQVELLSDEQRQRLVDDYVRGEALYREAKALNLDRDDQIIRRRLMQKMDYLAQGFYDDVDVLLSLAEFNRSIGFLAEAAAVHHLVKSFDNQQKIFKNINLEL